MDTRKTIRDILIIIIVVVLAVVVIGLGKKGPVERAMEQTQASAQGQGHSHGDGMQAPQGMESPHGGGMVMHELSDGEPIVSLGEYTIGWDWFEQHASIEYAELLAAEMDEESAAEEATMITLQSGLEQIVIAKAADDYSLQPDEAALAAREEQFYESFGGREEAEEYIAGMGMTIDRVRTMWREEFLMNALLEKVAELNGLDPASSEAAEALFDWVDGTIRSTEWTFGDPDLERLYSYYYMEEDGTEAAADEQTEVTEPAS